MIELKAHSVIGLDERCNSVDNVYYLKDEVDTVLAEKDKEIAELNDEIHKLKRALINARHEVAKARGKKSSTKKYIAKYSMRQND